jgi:predicted nucleotidyltransferase
MQSQIELRKKHSKENIEIISSALKKKDSLKNSSNLCIYVTGSYGREEGGENSDLDIFLIDTAKNAGNRTSRIKKTLIDADLIQLTKELGFPEFSGDGEYLKIHSLKEIKDNLGSPKDDYENYFTARMLLLLESKAIFNSKKYKDTISTLIEAYYVDYHDHTGNFLPVFLVNDIIRFWKTLCLNYEHRRNRSGNKSKGHLKNLKLKNSRMLTCFSAILWIISKGQVCSQENIMYMFNVSPLERLLEVRLALDRNKSLVDKIVENYEWFLEKTNRTESEVLEWISDQDNRVIAFAKAKEIGDSIYKSMQKLDKNNYIRYIVV